MPSHVGTRKAANIEYNRRILKSLAIAVLFCGKQCIVLRGDIQKPDAPGNPGNFLALLKPRVHNIIYGGECLTPSIACTLSLLQVPTSAPLIISSP